MTGRSNLVLRSLVGAWPRLLGMNSRGQFDVASGDVNCALIHFGMMIIVTIRPSMYGAFSTSPRGAISCASRSKSFFPVAT